MKDVATKPIPIRFAADEIDRLDVAAKSSGLGTRSTVVRFCTKMFLDDYFARGAQALPADWRQVVAGLDNRTITARVSRMPHVADVSDVEDYKVRKKTKRKRR